MPSEQAFRLTIWIVLVIFVTIGFLFLFFYKPLKMYLAKKHTCKAYYKKVNKIALYNDYYLVNNFEYARNSDVPVRFDHILAGEKFIYLITDKYYDGELCGRGDDENWAYYYKGKEKIIIKNPLYENKKEVKLFSIETGIARELLLGVVLINNECFVTSFDYIEGDSILIPLENLETLIHNYESTTVADIDGECLKEVVMNLHNNNLNNLDKNEQ